ncbi:MAG: hypothetical protein ACOCVP_05855 [Wenzhouxiangella sp.]
MQLLARWFGVPVLALLLSACGGQDPETASAPPTPPDRPAAAPRSAPAQAAPDPSAQAERVADADARPETVQQARAERDRLREHHARERLHWDEDTLTEQLGLETGQFQALEQARQTLLKERVGVRTGLQAQRQSRAPAEAGADSARREELQVRTRELRAQLDRAEQAWQDALRSILDADQLQRLAEQRPELLEPGGDR